MDQQLYLSSAAPSLALGNMEARSSATRNSIFALSTDAGHFGVEAGGLMIANYGSERGNIYINSNYSGTGVTSVILQPFTGGLDLIQRLRPITFTWKQGGMRDLGFGAEEVEKVEPLLVTYNSKGEVEGVKYDRITAALVNAPRKQQAQIEEQQQQIKQQQAHIKEQQARLERQQLQLDALKKLVCADRTDAAICKSN